MFRHHIIFKKISNHKKIKELTEKELQLNVMVAVTYSCPKRLGRLLREGVNPNIKIEYDGKYISALSYALMFGKEKVILQLLDAGANPNEIYTNKFGQIMSVNSLSVMQPRVAVVEKLLEQGLDPNQHLKSNGIGDFPFDLKLWQMFAVLGEKDIINLLFNKGVNLNIEVDGKYSIIDLLKPSSSGVKKIYSSSLKKIKKVEYNVLELESMKIFLNLLKDLNRSIDEGKIEQKERIEKSILKIIHDDSLSVDTKTKLADLYEINMDAEIRKLLLMPYEKTIFSMDFFMRAFNDLYHGGNDMHHEIAEIIMSKCHCYKKMSL